jgi:lipopolysaccharide biosynthesis protein
LNNSIEIYLLYKDNNLILEDYYQECLKFLDDFLEELILIINNNNSDNKQKSYEILTFLEIFIENNLNF